MVLIRNKPLSTDVLSDSQADLYNNNNAIDDSFGEDHYAASDTTANNGKHKVAQFPSQGLLDPVGPPPVVHPTSVADPLIYAFQDNSSLPVLNYSRGPNDAVPSPLTTLQSSSVAITIASGGTTTVLDFLTLPYSFGILYYSGFLNATTRFIGSSLVWWDETALTENRITTSTVSGLTASVSGTTLRVGYTGAGSATNVAWTLDLKRIWTPT